MTTHAGAHDEANVNLMDLLCRAIDLEASDVHVFPGYRVLARVHGEFVNLGDGELTPPQTREMIFSIAPPPIAPRIGADTDLDFSIALDHDRRQHRFRVNVFQSQGRLGTVLRLIPADIPTREWAGLPEDLVSKITGLRNGLVLITGVAGSGKSTTLSILVEDLNRRGGYRIITVEEPIEFVFPQRPGSMVTQREVGVDVPSFHEGLRSGLRQDPDVILVGEVRDSETAQLALSAAETGHLVLATLHTRDAKGAVSRFADLFPRDTQDEVRAQLALSLRYVVCQHLLPSAELGARRVLAMEIMVGNLAVANAIRMGKLETLDSAIQTGKRDGMMSLDMHLGQLVRAGRITMQTARQFASDPDSLTG